MRSSGIQIRVSDLLFAIQKHWKIIMMLTCVGLVFGLLLSGMTRVQSTLQRFNIGGSMAITTKNPDGLYLNGMLVPGQQDYTLPETMGDAVVYIMRSDALMNTVINDIELLGVNISQIRNSLSIRQYNATQILEMTLSWPDDEEGLSIWNAIVETTNAMLPDTLQIGYLAIIDPPEANLVTTTSSGISLWLFLAALGCAAGIGFAVMEQLMRPTLTNVKDVESLFGLETLGMITRDNAYFRSLRSILVQEENGSSKVVQNYAAAAYIVRNRLGTREQHHCFYVTSTINREGRSTVAANLAVQFSDMEHRTLLIDFDTRNPSLGSLFMSSVDYSHSFNALYRGDINEIEAITTLTGYLDILPMVLEHNAIPMDSMVIDMIHKLTEKYEYVIIDAPPVGTNSDTLSLNQVANTVLFVVGYDQATIPEIQSALEKLDKSGMRVLGCFVNRVQSSMFQGNGDKSATKGRKKVKKRKKTLAEEKFGDVAGAQGGESDGEPIEGLVSKPLVNGKGSKLRKTSKEKDGKQGKTLKEKDGKQRKAPKEKDGKQRKARKNKDGGTAKDASFQGNAVREKNVVPAQSAESASNRRHVLEDLMEEEVSGSPSSVEETVDALIRIGLEGQPTETDENQNNHQNNDQNDHQNKRD